MQLKYLFVRRHSDSIKEPTYFDLKSYKITKGRFLNRPLCFMLMWTNMNILWSSLVQTGSDIKILRYRVKMFYRWKIIGGGIHILPTCTFDIFEYWIYGTFDNILSKWLIFSVLNLDMAAGWLVLCHEKFINIIQCITISDLMLRRALVWYCNMLYCNCSMFMMCNISVHDQNISFWISF